MMDLQNRRAFLKAAMAAGAAWATADVLEVEHALAFAQQHAATAGSTTFTALTKLQADALDAMASRILPSVDGKAGAHECGAVYFIDRALATFNASQKKLYAEGIADLNRRAIAAAPGATAFAALAAQQQDVILKSVEQTPFFQAVRFDTLVGTFALPKWGGNKDFAGWHMLGFDHQPRFQAPFGFYDADANKRG